MGPRTRPCERGTATEPRTAVHAFRSTRSGSVSFPTLVGEGWLPVPSLLHLGLGDLDLRLGVLCERAGRGELQVLLPFGDGLGELAGVGERVAIRVVRRRRI